MILLVLLLVLQVRPKASALTTTTAAITGLDIEKLRTTIAGGRVYQQEHFIDEQQVQFLLRDIEKLRAENKMVPSGLSNTLKGQTQNFDSSDRSTAPVPWWNEVLSYGSSGSDISASCKNTDGDGRNHASDEMLLQSIINKIHNLRIETSNILKRPTMIESKLEHECYYSSSAAGSSLPRHMDERHEELKGPRGWMEPSRRSISWLIYLSDDGLEGGELRAFPQGNFSVDVGKGGRGAFAGSHNGNLQIGWIDLEVQGGGSKQQFTKTFPVYLNSWFNVRNSEGESDPHCILYTDTADNDSTQNLLYVTKPWNNDSIQMSTSDFIKKQARTDGDTTSSNNNDREKLGELSLFVTEAYAKRFRLLEDRETWAEGSDPEKSSRQNVIPKRGSLVMFDSVSVPHEVMMVEKNTRSALAGWFHEETQQFPVDFT